MGILNDRSWKRKFFFVILILSTLPMFLMLITFSREIKSQSIHSGFIAMNILKMSVFDNFSKYVDEVKSENVDDIAACKIPQLNPWDPLILKGIKHPKNLSCEQVQPFMTYIDDYGFLRYNETEKRQLENDNQNFTCFYYTFDRLNDTEDSLVEYGDEQILIQPVTLDKDFVEVKCVYNFTDNDENVFYGNLHAHPSDKKDRKFSVPMNDKLSVLMIILDSVSNSALQRNLPLTFNYTANVMGMKYLKGFNKIGDNSFPNQMAMLMGKRVSNDQDDMLREMEGDYSTIRYDSWPLIWKLYAEKGYATVFNEDNPHVGLFHFAANGFTKKPVDYYYHTFWKAVQTESNQGYTCFRNEPKSRLILDVTKRHAMSMNNKLQFVYTSTMELSHDHDNQVELLDDDFYSFWKNLYEGNYLNKTAIIFASDHGLRTGWIRTTLIGLLEERLPFLGIWFPPWFYRKYPNIKANLQQNTELLSSSFDVYETLKDILNCNYNDRQRHYSSRGQSHLYPLPKNRTCNQAGIPDHYCTCTFETQMNINDTLAVESANFLVNYLNHILKNVSDICSKIHLTKILFAKVVDVDEKVKKGIRNLDEAMDHDAGYEVRKSTSVHKQVRIGIETHPNQALFEALLRKEIFGKKLWSLSGTISRYSTYSGLSDCVQDRHLRKYCSCKNVS